MGHAANSSDAAARPTVHELQALAREATKPRRRRKGPLSRAARLHLIDILSRWGGAGLALIAGVSIFIAVSAGRAFPFRAAAWTLMVLAALYVCRRLRMEFRAGAKSAARPFRWQANYTSALSVVSAAFGAGALIIAPKGAPTDFIYQALALMLIAALGAGLLHAAHGRSAVAASAPATAFIFAGAWATGGAGLAFLGVGGAAATGAAALYLFRRLLQQRAALRFPRTSFQRREVDAGAKRGAGASLPSAAKASA
ncbi:MAG: hypothetical protein WD076_07260 [Parvularculaceae bacterium]